MALVLQALYRSMLHRMVVRGLVCQVLLDLLPSGICESVEKMLLRIEDAAKLLVREIPRPKLESPLSDPRLSSGILCPVSGKAHAKPCVGFAAVGSGWPAVRPTGIIGGAIRGT
jgi:hypothetical protein